MTRLRVHFSLTPDRNFRYSEDSLILVTARSILRPTTLNFGFESKNLGDR